MKGEGRISDEDPAKVPAAGGGVTIEDLQVKMAEFTRERNWDQFHSPRNLLLALLENPPYSVCHSNKLIMKNLSRVTCANGYIEVGEVGELSEIFQWKGEVPKGLPGWSSAEKEHLGEELSDVLLYLVRLADICGVDLGEAALRKVKKNGLKYPVERCKGSSKKCTQLANVVNEEEFRVDTAIEEYL